MSVAGFTIAYGVVGVIIACWLWTHGNRDDTGRALGCRSNQWRAIAVALLGFGLPLAWNGVVIGWPLIALGFSGLVLSVIAALRAVEPE
jgi:hypothetical protein